MNKKNIISFVVLLFLVFGFKNIVQAQFFENLQKYIDKIGGLNTTSTTIKNSVLVGFCFTKTLKLGETNNDIKEMQKFLALDKEIYPEGTVSGYFGKLTKKAVINFQNKYANEVLFPSGLRTGTGFVGNATIKKLNTLNGCSLNNSNISTPSGTIPVTTKGSDITLADTPDVSSCLQSDDHTPVCALIKTGQLITFPNVCFVNKLGYTKQCDRPCPCDVSTVDTTTNTTLDYVVDTTPPSTTTRTTKIIYPYIKKYGQNFPENLWEDKLYYPRMSIQDPVSLKEKLTLKNRYYDRRDVKGCDIQGGFKMCYDGTMPRPSGSVVITSPEQLGQYFTYSTSVFDIDYFKKYVIYLAYSYYPDKDSKGNCIFKYSQCSFDRIIYNIADLDELFKTNDTREYNYRDPKYDMIRPKFTCKKEGNGCSFECKEDDYMYDVIAIEKTTKRVKVDFETEERICSN